METYFQIQPIPYGLNRSATQANLIWTSKPFFSDSVCLRIELLGSEGEFMDCKDVHMSLVDYLSTGAEKQIRGEVIMNNNGIYLINN